MCLLLRAAGISAIVPCYPWIAIAVWAVTPLKNSVPLAMGLLRMH